MQNCTVLIVGNNEEIVASIRPRLGLSRDSDKVVEASLKGVSGVLKTCTPETIIFVIDSADEKILNACKKIKEQSQLSMSSIIFYIHKKYDEEFMLNAFEIGVDDFIYCPMNDSEISLRVKANLKRKAATKSLENQKKLMQNLGAIDENDIYQKSFAQRVFDVHVQNMKDYSEPFILMMFSCDEPEKLNSIIKKYARLNDTLGHVAQNIYYLMMPRTDVDKLRSFYKKLREEYGKDLNAAACEYNKNMDFKYFTTITLKALKEASLVEDIFVTTHFSDIETFEGTVTKKRPKNYKIFQKAFDKKTQNIILPAFQNMKLYLEEKYPYNVKIDFFATGTKCYFSLEHIPSRVEVAMKINHVAYSKVDLDTIYTHQTYQIINRIELDVNDISEKIVSKVVSNITKEFDRLLG